MLPRFQLINSSITVTVKQLAKHAGSKKQWSCDCHMTVTCHITRNSSLKIILLTMLCTVFKGSSNISERQTRLRVSYVSPYVKMYVLKLSSWIFLHSHTCTCAYICCKIGTSHSYVMDFLHTRLLYMHAQIHVRFWYSKYYYVQDCHRNHQDKSWIIESNQKGLVSLWLEGWCIVNTYTYVETWNFQDT